MNLLKIFLICAVPRNNSHLLQGYVLAVEQDIQTKKCTLYHPKIPDVNISDQLTWVALMQRNGCKFDEMVAISQNLIKGYLSCILQKLIFFFLKYWMQ